MSGNSFGRLFRITTWGESHGPAVGVVIDGCPPGVPVRPELIQEELDRRRPGTSRLTTQRREPDRVRILSGVQQGESLGTPIALLVENLDVRSQDYDEMRTVYRPSHADMTYHFKYGRRASAGGGRASARETAARVAAGAVARTWLRMEYGVEIVAWVSQIHTVRLGDLSDDAVSREMVEASLVRCPDPDVSRRMIDAVEAAREAKDSVGGVVEVVARNCPPGWGDPVFDKLEALLGQALLSIPAAKGVEIGTGFRGVEMRGSEHNDEFFLEHGLIRTRSNRSGGIQGGISNGMPIRARVAFKPTSTVSRPQRTVDLRGHDVELRAKGRHDPCVVPRAVPIVEAMTALVLIDAALRDRGQTGILKRSAQPLEADSDDQDV
ncbi:MAG TPA: chorismate synthase [Acidobacteriota bacterium]|nr:chorismate synthase [Acidobacteriota bacterium]